MRNSLVKFLMGKTGTDEGDRLVVLTGDLGYSVLEPVAGALGKRFINAGVAEASMVSMASSIAADGFKTFAYSIAPFATFRCLEQIRNDACYHNLDVTIVGVGAGFGYGGLGPTHHAIEDIAAMWGIPNLSVFNPADPIEAQSCFEAAWELSGPKYLRLGKGGEPNLGTHAISVQNNPVLRYRAGSSITILTTGTILGDVLEAAKTHADVEVLSCPRLKPFPEEELLASIHSDSILIVEELNPYGGFSAQAARTLLTQGSRVWKKVHTLSASDMFSHEVGSATHQREKTGLSVSMIADAIGKLKR